MKKSERDHNQDLKAVEEAFSKALVSCGDGSEAVRALPPPSADAALVLAQQRRARRLAIYEEVCHLRRQGWSGKAIALSLGIGKTTVFRYLASSQFPERKGKGRSRAESSRPLQRLLSQALELRLPRSETVVPRTPSPRLCW